MLRMLKKYLFAFGGLLTVTFILVMTLTALAQVEQPGQNKQGLQGLQSDMGGTQPDGTTQPGVPPPPAMPEGETMRGTISGKVVSIDAKAGVIEIVSEQGQPHTFKVDDGAKKQLGKIKKGDHVNLNLALRAVDIRWTEGG